MAGLPRISCAHRERAPGLENLQEHGMGEAEEEGAQSQTGFIRLVICPYKERRSESWCTRGPARLCDPAGSGILGCTHSQKRMKTSA